MPDDHSNGTESGGFDDWLSETPSKATDPYAEVELDATDDDIFDHGASDEPEVQLEPEPEVQPEPEPEPEPEPVATPEPEPEMDTVEAPSSDVDPVEDDDDASLDLSEESDDDAEDDTGEIPVVEPASVSDEVDELSEGSAEGLHAEPVVKFEAFDGDNEADTGELEIVVASPQEPSEDESVATLMYDGGVDVRSDSAEEDEGLPDDDTSEISGIAWVPETDDDESVDRDEYDPLEDTGEAVFVTGETAAAAVAAGSFGDLWDQDSDEGPISSDVPSSDDVDEFSLDADDLLLGATQEHIGLAAAIAAAENEDTEQVALVAEIPGLETSVVGFEDVVEAEGHRRVRARASGDLIARVVTGVILVLALGASLIWRPALVVFAIAVFVLGAGEFYTALVRTERRPIALFGFIGIVAASLGAFFWSAIAIPIAFLLATILLLLFYAVVPGKSDPMGNLALTATVMVWVGLGSYAMLIAQSDDYQVLIIGVVVAVAGADIAAFFVGRSLGRTHFAPWVSPKKTVEGLVAGVVVALGIGAMLHFFPPFELTSGLAIGAAAAFLTPMGDLAMSAAKRALGLKDMGSVLPGHGGFLDRIDGLLFVIPAAWAVFVWAGLL